MIAFTYLAITAPILTSPSVSTRNIRPITSVKNPMVRTNETLICGNGYFGRHIPLILNKIVTLATLVNCRDMFADQPPMKAIQQNTNAKCAVCLLVSGGEVGAAISSEC